MHFCGGAHHSAEKNQKNQKGKWKSRAAGDSDNRLTERMPWEFFQCGSEDHLISKFPKPPKEN